MDANEALDGFLKKLKRNDELSATKHKQAITLADKAKVLKLLSDYETNPTHLTKMMWFICTYHLGLRGAEIQAKMNVGDLELCTAPNRHRQHEASQPAIYQPVRQLRGQHHHDYYTGVILITFHLQSPSFVSILSLLLVIFMVFQVSSLILFGWFEFWYNYPACLFGELLYMRMFLNMG